jgi:hypothetical protein
MPQCAHEPSEDGMFAPKLPALFIVVLASVCAERPVRPRN